MSLESYNYLQTYPNKPGIFQNPLTESAIFIIISVIFFSSQEACFPIHASLRLNDNKF
jgi:hypothetical protein